MYNDNDFKMSDMVKVNKLFGKKIEHGFTFLSISKDGNVQRKGFDGWRNNFLTYVGWPTLY